ncbi:hypothetical protein O181_036997 [Austropuccinia psidii MF-1]|uniref:Uncharacterized protein n=1 Tax=Austropuccinia psidii MF-1 TaxID=1389203 RepID=A0A9Q3DBT1_9BASI|nr:hypothetical protein [Austropuccinia psidii MF-1]
MDDEELIDALIFFRFLLSKFILPRRQSLNQAFIPHIIMTFNVNAHRTNRLALSTKASKANDLIQRFDILSPFQDQQASATSNTEYNGQGRPSIPRLAPLIDEQVCGRVRRLRSLALDDGRKMAISLTCQTTERLSETERAASD